ncbi:hypothetical protein BK120_30385 [Paenibacillus sp. FSL A5-0031]|uniref:hypothetical protein n=1 Tax=Paenibacillus sp. FSL A5-0031 TaxID=1920420 RepID=UPI00096D7EB8|nr:hypothetical protein [Paenibacillus sp. FSL A5-0031]OME75973.1 hypothetical protein BK120_30385 [Paenibacillus sp. FSL A5-0031]
MFRNKEVEQFKDSKVKKQSLYKEIDLEAIMNRLQSGEMVELPEVYLGLYKKFCTRLFICKLTEEQTQKRLLMRAKQEKKKNITYKERTKRLSDKNSINCLVVRPRRSNFQFANVSPERKNSKQRAN